MDGTENMIPQSGKAVITENGIITDIIPEINVPAGVEKIDLCGEYILPGLINLHVHLSSIQYSDNLSGSRSCGCGFTEGRITLFSW